jgi:hypothetical protein
MVFDDFAVEKKDEVVAVDAPVKSSKSFDDEVSSLLAQFEALDNVNNSNTSESKKEDSQLTGYSCRFLAFLCCLFSLQRRFFFL